jgi:ribonucleoside-diphosphate reductase alpha chain
MIDFVTKKDGKLESFSKQVLLERVKEQSKDLKVDPDLLVNMVIQGLVDNIETTKLDNMLSEYASFMIGSHHPDYEKLAARIAITAYHKKTEAFKSILVLTESLMNRIHPDTGEVCPFFSPKYYEFIKEHYQVIDQSIHHEADFKFTFFGFKTLFTGGYLQENERPQLAMMRIACSIHLGNITKALRSYALLSSHCFTHASPKWFSLGTVRQQASSCFLLTVDDDSIAGMYSTLAKAAEISRFAGGLGINVGRIRAKDSYVAGTHGKSKGCAPYLLVIAKMAEHVNQAGKREGKVAIYVPVWHADVEDCLDTINPSLPAEDTALKMFMGLWIPNIFMSRVRSSGVWSMFCPRKCPLLLTSYGKEFDEAYLKYESEGQYNRQMPAVDLWKYILHLQTKRGFPYLSFSDACNEKNNQKNLGPLLGSNLCHEVLIHTAPNEIGVCNLCSVNLNVIGDNPELFRKTVHQAVEDTDASIDVTTYPVKDGEVTNKRNRPIGVGVQGLQNLFYRKRMSFTSPEARRLNVQIFEQLYYYAVEKSCELAQEKGAYSTFWTSPMAEGKFQFNLWNIDESSLTMDWASLRQKVMKHGLRNSLLIALMPTASTAQILGNIESIEPMFSNVMVRDTLAGQFEIVNQYLVEELETLGLWNASMRARIIANEGSIQSITEIPEDCRERYKTFDELRQMDIAQMAIDRAKFVCQTQSLNFTMKKPTYGKLTTLHFMCFDAGLKGSNYYIRTKTEATPMKASIEGACTDSCGA